MDRALGRLLQCFLWYTCGWSIAAAQGMQTNPAPFKPDRYSARQEWRADLIRKGYYNPLAPKPFRIAIPLTERSDPGPQLMLGFAPRMREIDGRNVILLFTTINIE